MSSPSEKRRSPRTKSDCVLELYDESGHFITGVGKLLDLSTVGARFSSRGALEVGDLLKARLRLPKAKVELPAKVVWVRARHADKLYGIEFQIPLAIKP